jgi:glycosyltransferase involved in cell wall biosynthesis
VGRRAIFRFTLLLGRCLPSLYDLGYALRWHAVPELADALARRFDAYHANDWDTVLLAARAARRHKAHLVVDLHEYAPLQFDHRRDRWLFRSMVRHVLRRHATQADAVLTVAPLLAERYREEFALDPIVVLNAPDRVALSSRSLDPAHVRLLHHGVASPLRRPEIMIETVARCDPRYTLHFMLLPSDYVQHLRTLAAVRAPGRVFFHDPVTPEAVVRRIAEFDVGLNVIAPTTYNYRVALPNKFFEGVAAGLAMCIGPSPSMAAVVAQYGLGCIAPSFAPDDLAATLNRTTAKQWEAMRQAAREAAPAFTAAREMAKVVQIYQRLFG